MVEQMETEKDKTEVIKSSVDKKWWLFKHKDTYGFIENVNGKQKLLKTPGDEILCTSYLVLAERILKDVAKFGSLYMSSESILPWHYTMMDNFVKMDHEEVEDILDHCFIQKPDWTFSVGRENNECVRLFGTEKDRPLEIKTWLSKCTHMQMTAACCIGNTYHSINIAFVLAALMENYSGMELQRQFKYLAELLDNNFFYGPTEDFVEVFNTFCLYYGIHLQEDGAIINQSALGINSSLHMDPVYSKVCLNSETLVGRNFYHYTDGVVDKTQPIVLEPVDIELYEEERDKSEDPDSEENLLSEYIPKDCWIKKISAWEDEQELNRLIVIQLDDNSNIKNVTEFTEQIHHMGNGLFMIPGLDTGNERSYEMEDELSVNAKAEIELLVKQRVLKQGTTFIGKKLPEEILDGGGNGGSKTNYTYAMQSAYRRAYMHMSIDTTEEGIIEGFSYSSYQSTGSDYWDMFSRPQGINDKHEEQIDMLLFIIDKYSDSEYNTFITG